MNTAPRVQVRSAQLFERAWIGISSGEATNAAAIPALRSMLRIEPTLPIP